MAREQRHIHLLQKIHEDKALSAKEIKELEQIEARTRQVIFKNQKEAATYAGVSVRTIRRWAEQGMPKADGGGYIRSVLNEYKEKSQLTITPKFKKVPTDSAEYQRKYMALKRADERDIILPPIQNPRRRNNCNGKPELFCTTYFPYLFFNPFTENQSEMIRLLIGRITYGGFQALAEPRSDGKSTIIKVIAGVYCVVYGLAGFIVLIGPNNAFAESMLEDIKTYYDNNDLLAADFPEVCIPVRALLGVSQRALAQTINGERTRMKWGKKDVVMPVVKNSKGKPYPASGCVLTTRGIDAAIRGLVKAERRPDLAVGDDIETRDSVRSPAETAKRKATLESDVLGLAGPNKKMPTILLGTIFKRGCIIDQLTDRKQNPAWHGIRRKRLLKTPKNSDLWATYIELRQREQLEDDESTCRKAHRFYLKNRKDMDAGAKVNNPYRFVDNILPDKSRLEVSALQACYNEIADMSLEHFNTEYQNSPPEDELETSGIEMSMVQKKLSGLDKGKSPSGTIKITYAVDPGRRVIHWTKFSWQKWAIGSVIDYGTQEVHSPAGDMYKDTGVKKAIEEAIFEALLTLKETIITDADLCLIDSRWLPDPVHQFCAASGGKVFRACRGFGSNTRIGKYRPLAKSKLPQGPHWRASLKPGTRLMQFDLDADYFKMRVHDGFMTPENQKGCLTIYGDDAIIHRGFAEQILAEIWVRDWIAGKGYKETWQVRHRLNHFLDCAACNIAAAEILGITIVRAERPDQKKTKPAAPRKTKKQNAFLDGLGFEL